MSASRAKQQPEAAILAAIRLALADVPGLVLWRLSQGVAAIDGRTRRYGLVVGAADLVGILAPAGRLVGLEVKTPAGRARPEQRQWAALVRRHGGFCCVVRSVDEARAAIERAKGGASE